ncbi:MAG TPA: MmgE/PrpD family protein, partial [Candidatus Limnocylindria bacterium]|nr:MmgE/PrpD family protein [Candidatus Limnocylindria bacterium]
STDLPATLVQQIARNVLSVDASAIPLEVVEHTKALILDSVGCALAAIEESAFARASRVLAQLGGNPDCTVIGSSRRVNLPQAVLLNGILIRSLDLNDAYIGPGQMGHPSDNIAVALSVGEKFGASGLDVIASVALGYEIYCRMQDIIPARGTWDHTTASALAAPLIAGRLMGLNAEQLAHAAALSATHGNTLAVVRTGQLANSKANANAMVASQAVLCSLFAAEGVTGSLGVIEHPRGLSTGMLAGANLALLAEPIGERYRILTSAIKAYPCIGTAQTMVAGVLQARAGIADPAREVKRIEVVMADIPIVSTQAADQQRRYPESRESADHSFFYLAAAALSDGEISEAQFAPGRWLQPAMREAMARVSVRTDPSLNTHTPGSYPAVVKLILQSGESREVEVIFPKGHPNNPMSPAEVETKFRACARGCLTSARQDKVIANARELEKLPSVADLMQMLAECESGTNQT